VSWLEASHIPTTLAGHVGWLPMIIIARLGADPANRSTTDPAPAHRPPADVPPVAPAVRTPTC
jgi:hypothetical protein